MPVRQKEGISPLEERKGAYRKKPRQDELSYAEACGLKERNMDSETEWTVVNGRRRIKSTADKANVEVYDSKGGREERRERQTSKRSEAILVKVGQDANWIEAYRKITGAKDVLKESTGVRKTKAVHILIEINNKVSADKVAKKLKTVMRKKLEILPLANRETLKIRNIDPIVTREELTEDIAIELDIRDVRWITIKALRMAPWETQ